MQYCNLCEINRALREDAEGFVARAEADFSAKLEQAAKRVLARADEHPIVLLSGPSGSGKTTSAFKISSFLNAWGRNTHILSMDNYFLGQGDSLFPLDDEGNVDLESPLRLDSTLLGEHLEQLSQCRPVLMPTFDFARQVRTEVTVPLERRPGELVILEGIHALNPEVTGRAGKYSTGIYVSVRTRLTGEGGVTLHPEKIRLLRRLLRDSLYRGQSYYSTFSRLYSVSRGENLYIMPYKDRAEINVDTLLPYELAVYRDELLRGIDELDDAFMHDMRMEDIREMLHQSESYPMGLVPGDSLLREFIGES